MRLTWLILHREQRHRCAPDAECPYLVITRPHAGHLGVFIPHDETTTFNVDFPAPASQKVATKPTRLVHPSSWLPPTSIPTFPHQKAEKSPQNQHVLSYNPKRRRCGERRRAQEGMAAVPLGGGGAWPQCRWAAAGPGRASRRRAERSSRRGRLAGGPPPTGTHSGPAPQPGPAGAPNTSGTNQHNNRHRTNAPRHTKNRHPRSDVGLWWS